jgi:hypothetical protein
MPCILPLFLFLMCLTKGTQRSSSSRNKKPKAVKALGLEILKPLRFEQLRPAKSLKDLQEL